MSVGLSRIRRLPRPVVAALAAVLGISAILFVTTTNPAVSQSAGITAFREAAAAGLGDPEAGVWSRVPGTEVPLSAQNTTYPFGGGTIPTAVVRAVQAEDKLFVHVTWSDPTMNDSTDGVYKFTDAGAVQFPAASGSTVPFFCMGQADGGVNIWQWRADTQAGVPEDIEGISENGYVDFYPSTENLWYSARDVGNVMAEETKKPVQNLVAQGFGTLTASDSQPVRGKAVHTDDEWKVVYSRDFVAEGEGQPSFQSGGEFDIAFAAWDGARQQRNGQKSVSQFVTLTIGSEAVPASKAWIMGLLLVGPFLVFGVIAIVFWRWT